MVFLKEQAKKWLEKRLDSWFQGLRLSKVFFVAFRCFVSAFLQGFSVYDLILSFVGGVSARPLLVPAGSACRASSVDDKKSSVQP